MTIECPVCRAVVQMGGGLDAHYRDKHSSHHNAGSQIRRALEMLHGIEGPVPSNVEVEILTAEMALRRAREFLGDIAKDLPCPAEPTEEERAQALRIYKGLES